MRLDWTEPWSRRLAGRRLREVRRGVGGLVPVTVVGTVLAAAVCVAVRVWVPGAAEALPWWRIGSLAVTIPVPFLGLPFLGALFPLMVHFTEKGVMFQTGSGGAFFKWGRIESVGFRDEGGFHFLVVRVRRKAGDVVERMAVASPEVADAEVGAFLVSAGQGHLWR